MSKKPSSYSTIKGWMEKHPERNAERLDAAVSAYEKLKRDIKDLEATLAIKRTEKKRALSEAEVAYKQAKSEAKAAASDEKKERKRRSEAEKSAVSAASAETAAIR